MFVLKNIFVFLVSIITLCLLIIFLNYIGVNNLNNIIISSAAFGIFTTLYFKDIKICLSLFSLLFLPLFFIAPNLEISLMFMVSLFSYFIINMTLPKLKDVQFKMEHLFLKTNKN